jgi:hypothetical protein
MGQLYRALCVSLIFLPSIASACGGLFCNAATPVVQDAEHIVFATDGAQVDMVVRLTWGGPPTEFGWLLPVPADVETTCAA